MSEWTTKDETELNKYEKQLKQSKIVRENTAWIVGATIVGLIALAAFIVLS